MFFSRLLITKDHSVLALINRLDNCFMSLRSVSCAICLSVQWELFRSDKC